MSKNLKILINGLTLDDANLVPLFERITYWKKKAVHVEIIGTANLFTKLEEKTIDDYINLGDFGPMGGGFSFISNSTTRNIYALKRLNQINRVDAVYSISSVLDLVILPYFLKKTKKAKKWVTVFDNTVPIFSGGKMIAGNPLIRILAWIFFQLSLILLKSADHIFVVKPELKKYLIKKGFDESKLVVTGNGVEKDLILKAKDQKKYQSDGLFVGRINEAKGIYDLLRVLVLVKKELPKFNLAIMGGGDPQTIKMFIAKIKALKLKKDVNLLGYKKGQEKYDIIKSCKVFLFLSHTESVPVAPLEAVCSGKITLVYDLDAYKMYKNNEVIKFKQGDYQSVANKIIEIYKKGDFTNKAGTLLLNKYDWKSISAIEFKYISR